MSVRKGDKLAGLVVDNLIGQMEIVIKSLGKYININRMISGATILGDGSVALDHRCQYTCIEEETDNGEC